MILKRVFVLLFLLAAVPLAARDDARDISGMYNVSGRNPNGSRYVGTVVISQVSGNTYSFTWKIGQQTFEGQGELRGDTISVDWGQTDPVIYKVRPDGTLMGLWARGTASETLTKSGG